MFISPETIAAKKPSPFEIFILPEIVKFPFTNIIAFLFPRFAWLDIVKSPFE